MKNTRGVKAIQVLTGFRTRWRGLVDVYDWRIFPLAHCGSPSPGSSRSGGAELLELLYIRKRQRTPMQLRLLGRDDITPEEEFKWRCPDQKRGMVTLPRNRGNVPKKKKNQHFAGPFSAPSKVLQCVGTLWARRGIVAKTNHKAEEY